MDLKRRSTVSLNWEDLGGVNEYICFIASEESIQDLYFQ